MQLSDHTHLRLLEQGFLLAEVSLRFSRVTESPLHVPDPLQDLLIGVAVVSPPEQARLQGGVGV